MGDIIAGAGVAVIAIVCIGFLVFLVVLGVSRVRSAQRRSVDVNMDDKPEMEWDNSALNITVNPMELEVSNYSFFLPFDALNSSSVFFLVLWVNLSS